MSDSRFPRLYRHGPQQITIFDRPASKTLLSPPSSQTGNSRWIWLKVTQQNQLASPYELVFPHATVSDRKKWNAANSAAKLNRQKVNAGAVQRS